MSINSVTISGNLGQDAELREVSSNSNHVLNFSVAVTDRRRNQQSGEWEDHVNWIRCAIFGPRAEKLAQYLTKGTKVAIKGSLRTSDYQDKEGNNRTSTTVIVDNDGLEFMSRGNSGSGSSNPASAVPAVEEEDVPF